MLLAIRFFTALDAVAKALVRHYSTPQVEWARFSGQLVRVMLVLGHWRYCASSSATPRPKRERGRPGRGGQGKGCLGSGREPPGASALGRHSKLGSRQEVAPHPRPTSASIPYPPGSGMNS